MPKDKKINLLFDATEMVSYLLNGTGSGIFMVSLELLKGLKQRKIFSLELYCSSEKKHLLEEVKRRGIYPVKDMKIFDGSSLDTIDVFFSPMRAVPEFIENNPKIQKYVMVHDIMPVKFNQYWKDVTNHWYEKLFNQINSSDFYFTNSRYTQADLIKYNINASKDNTHVCLLGCGEQFCVSLDNKQKVMKKYNIPSNKKYVFSLCSIEPRKNLIRAVKTFASFVKKNKLEDIVFVLGGGKWGTFLEKLKDEIGSLDAVQNQIKYIGYVDEEDLPTLYSGAEWFVYTSQYEGFGLPPLEAMACGCSVITSNNSSLPEVVGDAGIMIDWDSDEQHIKAYEKYYFDKKFRDEMANRGLKRSRQFSWEKAIDEIEKVIKNRMHSLNSKVIFNNADRNVCIDVNSLTIDNYSVDNVSYQRCYNLLKALSKNKKVKVWLYCDYHNYAHVYDTIVADKMLSNYKLITQENLKNMDVFVTLGRISKCVINIGNLRHYILDFSEIDGTCLDEVSKGISNRIFSVKGILGRRYRIDSYHGETISSFSNISFVNLFDYIAKEIIRCASEDTCGGKDIVPIVMLTDNNYVIPTIVTATSIQKNKYANTNYAIYVLGNALTKENITKLEAVEGVKVILHKDRFSQFAGAKSHCTTTDLFKFDLPLIFTQYDKILYLDVDMIIQHDLSGLFDTDVSDKYAAAVKDMVGMVKEKDHTICGLQNYFNAGMMLLNLKKMRDDDISNKLIYYKKYKDRGHFMSQDALNSVFNDNVRFVSPRYNYMGPNLEKYTKDEIIEFYDISEAEYEHVVNNATIIHLTNKKKPWNTQYVWGADLWRKYYLLSPLVSCRYFYVNDEQYMGECEKQSTYLKGGITVISSPNLKKINLKNITLYEKLIVRYSNAYTKVKTYVLGVCVKRKKYEYKPTIVLIYDYPDWILGRWAKQIQRVLGNKYNFILTSVFDVQNNQAYYKNLFAKVDVVHPMAFQQYNFYKKLMDKSKLIVTVHHWLDYKKEVESIATDCCQIVTGSSQWKKAMIKNGISPYKVDVIFSGIEDRFLQEHKPLYRKNKKIINIGFFAKATSNTEDRKGTRHFVSLLNEIKLQNKQNLFHIYLTGTGWEQFVKQIKKDGFKVTYIPFVPDEDMPRLYKTLDFYLMLSDVEGGPVTVIEAMASKTPVLATNIGVVQDIGEDKKNIVLIDNKNSKDILQKILYYKDHQDELDEIIDNAYKTAQNMTYDKTFAPLEQVYNKFLYGRKLTGALLDIDALNKRFMKKAYSVQDEKKRKSSVQWKMFGISLNDEVRKFYFFGIPIFSSRQGIKKNGDIKLKHYIFGLPYFVKEKADFKKTYKLLGISKTWHNSVLGKTFLFSKQKLTSSDVKGLSKPEQWGRWSDGKAVDMLIKLPTDKGDLKCCFALKPYLNEKFKKQIVSVTINDKFMVDWNFELGKSTPKTEFIIPKSLLKKSGKTFFSFKIKQPVSPKELGLGSDGRKLGIGFISMQIVPAVVKETKFQKYWKQVKTKILPKPKKDYSAELKALSDELLVVRKMLEDLKKEIKELKN